MRRVLLVVGVIYLLALGASHLLRPQRPSEPTRLDRQILPVEAVEVSSEDQHQRLPKRDPEAELRLAYREWSPNASEAINRIPIVLLHGSPGSADDFATLGPVLGERHRVLAPDLPGFGSSSRKAPSYSLLAHADYTAQLLEKLEIPRAHVLGFSMGGGVGLYLLEHHPDRVASMVMVSAIGVQELELLGSFRINRAVHAAQLWIVRALHYLTPHFGILDDFPLNPPYARNFYDSDQRPLRGILESMTAPMMIVHGVHDPLVPMEAALEHYRIVPQSELARLDSSHFFVFRGEARVGQRILDFFERVEAGSARDRSSAEIDRVTAAGRAFDRAVVPPWTGPAALVVLLLIALGTLISEDLSCIAAGLLVAQGRLSLLAAILACYVGILVGDLLLFWLGRSFGRSTLRRAPLRWWISSDAIDQSSKWLRRRGAWVILISRFLPGARLPTNLAAGVLHTHFWKFLGYFAIAGALWTPLIVSATAQVGEGLSTQLGALRGRFLLLIVLLGAVMYAVRHLAVPLLTWSGRRRLGGRWRKLTRWEFWPWWAIYPPVILYVLYLGARFRSLTLFTAVNPSMPHGGFVGESKSDIYAQLTPSWMPAWCAIPKGPPEERAQTALGFRRDHGLSYPLVLKPDAGQRGQGVAIVRSEQEIRHYFERTSADGSSVDAVAQEYAEGEEFGIFWMRGPEEETGEIFSINSKVSHSVVGDGESSLAHLILADDRAATMAETYLRENPGAEARIPEANEKVQLVEVGAHSRGTLFLDANDLNSEALRAQVAKFADSFEGFDFGRLDVRVPTAEALERGEPFCVLEVNGVTSEATHMYDPRYSLRDAQRILKQQWRRAFEIGDQRRRQGYRPSSVWQLMGAFLRYREPKTHLSGSRTEASRP